MNNKTKKILIIVGISFVALIIGVTLYISWRVYRPNYSHKVNTVAGRVSGNNGASSCENNGVIIVQFSSSSKEQQKLIINQEGASIKQEYDSFPGLYALNVTIGKEKTAIAAFLKHSEVQTANPNHCYSTNATQ